MRTTKTCTKCGHEKSLNDFHKNKSFKDGLNYWCKVCMTISNRKRYLSKRESLIQYSKDWNNAHLDRRLELSRNRRAKIRKSGGKITSVEWASLLERYNYTCLKCKRSDVKLTLDHVIPLSLGGTHTIDNAQPLCSSCNSSKKAKYIDYRIGWSL